VLKFASLISYQFAFKDRSFQTVQRFSKSLKPPEKRFYGNTVFDNELVSALRTVEPCRVGSLLPTLLRSE